MFSPCNNVLRLLNLVLTYTYIHTCINTYVQSELTNSHTSSTNSTVLDEFVDIVWELDK